MWEAYPLATLGATTACNRDSFAYFMWVENVLTDQFSKLMSRDVI
jgi:hypothetical protein